MFERYTERARRAIFFARYEASQFGSTTIEAEHLLLGLLREDRNLPSRLLPSIASVESIRESVARRLTLREKVATSIDLPLSVEAKRILGHGAEEAEKLSHGHIGPEHLLLGVLREEKCVAAQVLTEHGLILETARQELVRNPMPQEPVTGFTGFSGPRPLWPFFADNPGLPKQGVVPDADTAKRIAEAVWLPLFGAAAIAEQTPARAELKHNIWIVTGSMAPEKALFAVILQFDGRVVSVGCGSERPQKDSSEKDI